MNYYLIRIQYLGFRFHGWQRQPGVKTVESMVMKTLAFVLGHGDFKILGAGRTDAMVSAGDAAFELFMEESIDADTLLADLNLNLPPDIRALSVDAVGPEFNIIQAPKAKTYIYLFCFGEKPHPFCAPFMANFMEHLDISLMAEGARRFIGSHDFVRYCTRPGEQTNTCRTIQESRIEPNTRITASFFPTRTWMFRVRAKGFMRHQVRLMMGQLIALGQGRISLADLEDSLSGKIREPLDTIAPASGLMLDRIDFSGFIDTPNTQVAPNE
ncbi:MAG TPA: tRNA pseudouridine(38-40) synthase TruA [Desulfobacteraceae bacterium]|nr:tRNA pseudouridine(38-40) synthase TruA [Desulfobacteraceae bacterium]